MVKDQSSKKKPFGEEVNSKGMKTSVGIRGDGGLWVSSSVQNPQEQSDQQAMRRFKVKLLSLVVRL